MESTSRRIKFAFYLEGWSFENGSVNRLKSKGARIEPSGYDSSMDGNLFCPACYTNLNRVPKNKDHFTNGREAYFCHLSKYADIECDLRSKRAEGKRYDTYEDAQKAIDNEDLVIIDGFIKDRPEAGDATDAEYDETPVEDINGETSNSPIVRHTGDERSLPSVITTVNGLCRNFDKNLYKYFHLPGKRSAFRLVDQLNDIRDVTEEDSTPRLYFGLIESSTHLGQYQRPDNIRLTYLEHNQPGVADFCLKLKHREQASHGIGDDSAGRYLIVYGEVKGNGTGLCFSKLGWGEFGLLPRKYNSLLD